MRRSIKKSVTKAGSEIRKPDEGKNKENEENFRLAIERVSDAFVALDINWCYTYMNKRAGEIFGRDPKTMVGRHIWTEFPEGVGQPFYEAYHKAMKEQKYLFIEEFYQPYCRWFANHIYPSPNGLSIYFNDITEKKLTEEKMRISEARSMKAQEMGKLGYWELEKNGSTIWGSSKTLQIFGFPQDKSQVSVEEVEACIPEVEKVRKAAADLIERDKKYHIEFLINPANGDKARYISAIAELEKDKQGKPIKIMGVLQDITEQKAAEDQLLKAYRENTSILESITDGFLAVDKSWDVKYWNKAAERIMGMKRENIIGQNLWAIYSEAVPLSFYAEFNRAMDQNISVHFEDYFPPLDTWFGLNVYPSPEGLSIFFQDITEIKRQDHLFILEKETLEMYASHNFSLEEIIEFLLKGIQKIHPEMICSVLKIKGGKMYTWSSPHLPASYNEKIDGLPVGIGTGSCGAAAYLREKVEVSDIATHPFWKEYKGIAALYELKTCWSYPIIDSGQNLLGTFGIYYKKIHFLKKSEELTIERARIILVSIMENMLAEKRRKVYKEQLELIYNSSTDVIFLIAVEKEARYKFISVNKPFLDATGKRKEMVEDHYVEDIFPKISGINIYGKCLAAIQSGKVVLGEETMDYVTGDRTGMVSISPVLNEKGECTRLLGIIHDITERKSSEEKINLFNEELKRKNEELEEKNSRLEGIAWIQSHKVRAPLARIMGLIDLITNHSAAGTDNNELLGYVLSSAHELDKLLREIVEKTEQIKTPGYEPESNDH
ncbi:MAG: PAS domain S-box protein [Cytophagaceae bacterium]